MKTLFRENSDIKWNKSEEVLNQNKYSLKYIDDPSYFFQFQSSQSNNLKYQSDLRNSFNNSMEVTIPKTKVIQKPALKRLSDDSCKLSIFISNYL